MHDVTLTVRQADGAVADSSVDEAMLERLKALKADGVLGREMIELLVEVDPAAVPLSIHVCGKDTDGLDVDEFFCP
jgi:hypothetical protein